MDTSEIAQLILSNFQTTNSKPNHVIQERWITQVLAKKLNPKEVGLIDAAIDELVNKGFVTTDNRNGMFCVVLTQLGFEHIFPIDNAKVIEQISSSILAEFARINSKPNHVIQERWITQVLMGKLNPREKELVNAAIDELVNKGFVTTDNRNGMACIVLTQLGFDEIY